MYRPIILLALLMTAITYAQEPPVKQPRCLGVPIQDANLISYRVCPGYGVEGHDLLCWVSTAESGAHFCALDLVTGKLDVKPLNHLEGYPLTPATDGCVYVGSTTGEIWRYRATGSVWEVLARPWDNSGGKGIHHVRVLCEGKDGWLYAGSCYGERARVNRQTGEVQMLPALTEPGSWYVSSVAALPDGRIAFGLGHVARIVVYDPAQGKEVGQWAPQEWLSDGFVITMTMAQKVLYATHFPSGRRGAFDAASGKFLAEVAWPPAVTYPKWSVWGHSAGYGAGIDYYVLPDTDTIVTCDGKLVHTWNPTDGAKTMEPAEFQPPPALAQELKYSVTSDLRVLQYDPARLKVLKETVYEQPRVQRGLFGLGLGPDGCLYGGAFQSTHLFRYDPGRDELKDLGDHNPGWSGETYSYCLRGKELVCASYINGAVVLYDPAKAWKCDNVAQVNPRFVGCLGQYTYRPLSCTSDSAGRVWGVGAAGWGSTGGGVSWIDPETGKTGTARLPAVPFCVEELQPGTLLIVDGGTLRWWDTEQNVEAASVAFPAGVTAAALMKGNTPGHLAFCTSDKLHLADPSHPGELNVVQSFPLPFPAARMLWESGRLIVGAGGGIAELDPQTGQWQKLCDLGPSCQFAFSATPQAVFFTRGPEVWMVERAAKEEQ